jgi:hypothetical protein
VQDDEEDAGSDDKGNDDEPPVTGSVNTLWCKAKPVVDKYCVACHNGKGGGGSPKEMPLLTAADFSAEAPISKGKKVYEAVATRTHDAADPMPPRAKLTTEELAALDAFVAAKAPAGDNPTCDGAAPGDAGTPPAEAWPPAECDEIYKITSHGATKDDPYMVPPGQEIHPQVYWDAPWGNEKVQAIAFHPVTDNMSVLHHWILYSAQGAFLTGWAPGDDERTAYPSDIGMNMPTGARSLRLDMHYFNLEGKEAQPDNSGLEVCVVKGNKLRPKAAAVTMALTSLGPVLAPAGAKDKPITGTCNVQTTQPVHLMTASPHAHTYATHMKFSVKKKDGTTIVMHDGPFKFGEQQSYNLDPDVVVETGDTIYTTCSYTNNTTRNITFGESTGNEMCFNFASYWPAGAFSCAFGFPGLGGFGGLGGN